MALVSRHISTCLVQRNDYRAMLWNILEHGNHWKPLPWTKQMLYRCFRGPAGQFSKEGSGACHVCPPGSFSVAAWRISANFNDFLVSSWTVLTCFGAWRMA